MPALGPGCDAGRVCQRVDAVQARLREAGLPLALGISTPAAGVRRAAARLRRGARRAGLVARRRRRRAAPDGAVRLPDASAPDTARRLVDPALREALADDRARGGGLRDTVRALAAADLQIAGAARLLQVHPNTPSTGCGRIEERTGRNPRRVADLIELLVAIELEG